MPEDMTIELDGEQYVVRPEGGGLQIGRSVDGATTWLDTVDGALLPTPAREALERGDTTDAALQSAIRGVVQAQTRRGG